MKTFRELGLSEEFVSVLEKAGIKVPSEIQEKTIPLVLAGKDVIGGSATGSGKTLAFSASIVENLKKERNVQALILTPTRELAEQVSTSLAKFSRHRNLKVLSIYGGVDIERQIRGLRDADVVVGTPGRILDHMTRNTLDLNYVKFLVLDEVDRMFDMGFQIDVEKILKKCPSKRQTMLFSATISSGIDYLAKKYTKSPEEVSVESHLDASKLKQIFYDVPDGLKFSLIVHLLKKEKSELVMIFCGTRRNVDFVVDNLSRQGINAKAIHGGLNQNKRNRVLDEFNSNKGVSVMVCTDVAARGLDIKGVSHVYNYDLPKTSEDYIHRIGRTARAGKDGIAINILASRDYENFSNIKRDDKLVIEKVELPFLKKVEFFAQSRGRGGRDSSRRSFGRDSRGPKSGGRYSRGREISEGGSSRGPRSGGSKGRNFGGRRDSRGKGSSSGSSRGRDDRRGSSKPRGRSGSGGRGSGSRDRGRSSGGPRGGGQRPGRR